jgi:N-acetylglucosaminyl-diphospho-decaprenol L-rhamnosyltransferase
VVLFASYSGALGGAERLLVDWATGFDEEVALACPEGALAAAAREHGLRVFPLRARRAQLRGSARDRTLAAWRLWAFASELRALVAALNPGVVAAWGMRSALASRSLSPPVVFHHNDFLPGPLIGRAVRAAAARAALVTAPSAAVAQELGGRVEVIHPGVELDRFASAAAPAAPVEVVVAGALVGWKRPDLALEAVALARRRVPQLRLRFLGAPLDPDATELVEGLRSRAAAPDLTGAVQFAGEVTDIAPELARATCLLHCADREPFGLVVLEALAAGRPAVVAAGSGPDEIVDETCAISFAPGDAGAAAAALVRLASDPEAAAAMGAAARARARRFEAAPARARFAQAVATVRRAPSPEPGPPLEIVTVTHNSGSVIEGLLASAARHLPGVRVLVVDCASSDATLAIARSAANAAVVALGENVGFGGGCNRGVAEVSAPVTALLNPDVELLDDSLLALAAEAARGDAPERLLAPLVLGGDGRRQDSAHPAPGSPAALAGSVLPFTVLPARLAAAMAPWRASSPRPVGWAVGCALVARTETLRRLGPFDERIFMYGEDLDLGLRAADERIETWFWPLARVLHHGGHATSAAFGGEPVELLARARRVAIQRRRGRRRALADDAAQAVTFGSRAAGRLLLGRPLERERRQLRAVRAARRTGGQ